MPLVKVVLDVLKPRELSLADLVEKVCELEGVEVVTAEVIEVDVRTETLKLSVEGGALKIERLLELLDTLGCAVRSVDTVVARRRAS